MTTSAQTQLDAKQAITTGAASSIVTDNLTPLKVLFSSSAGKVLPSTVGLSHHDNLSAHVQTQLNGKQAAITGAASSIVTDNLTPLKVLFSLSAGKVLPSTVDIA